MPRLIDDVVVVESPPERLAPILEPVELEWTKDKEGVYCHNHFRIVPDGGKFVLEVTEPSTGKGRKGKVGKTTQACKGPLKVCKGFALDISEGRLVKMDSGNWGAPPASEVEEHIPGVLTDDNATVSYTPTGSPLKTPAVEVAAEIPIATSVLGLSQSIAILSREYPISALPPGSHFSQGGRFGTFIEMVGTDAKVEWDNKTTQWSGASPVKWAAERPIKEAKVKPVAETPAPSAQAPSQESKTSPVKTPPSVNPPQSKEGKGIFGFAIWRVVTTLANKGFTAEEIGSILKAHHSEKSSTGAWIKQASRRPDEGAALTPDQIKQLKNIVGKK